MGMLDEEASYRNERGEKLYGKKYDFELVLDKTQRSGLRGLPAMVESRILAEFKKEDIMANPEKVL